MPLPGYQKQVRAFYPAIRSTTNGVCIMRRQFTSGLNQPPIPYNLPALTFVVWFRYFNASFPAPVLTIASAGGVVTADQIIWFYLNTSTNTQFVINETNAGSPGNVSGTSITNNDGKWHFAAFSFATAAGATNKGWLDGFSGTAANAGSPWAWPSSNTYYHSCAAGNTSFFVNTTMDIFGPVWFQAQLADWQIAALRQGYDPRRVAPGQLLGMWPRASRTDQNAQPGTGNGQGEIFENVALTQGYITPNLSIPMGIYTDVAGSPSKNYQYVAPPDVIQWDEGLW